MKRWILGLLSTTSCFILLTTLSDRDLKQVYSASVIEELDSEPKPELPTQPQSFEFSLTAFGDSGWAYTHQSPAQYRSQFKKAYLQFDPKRQLLGDLNYLNWETSVGEQCRSFWAPPSASTFAFLTHPQELQDAIGLGFNLIGLANNHSYDCLTSPVGKGPLQTIHHLSQLKAIAAPTEKSWLTSGVFRQKKPENFIQVMQLRSGELPVLFVSAYVGGNADYCRYVVCAQEIPKFNPVLKKHRGLRILALHSWDSNSHKQLKKILMRKLKLGLIDVGLGSGPHIAEPIQVISTPTGWGIYATSLGNFIHPSLAAQPNNAGLVSRWRYTSESNQLELLQASKIQISCQSQGCQQRSQQLIWAAKPE